MTQQDRRTILWWGALGTGAVLFLATLYFTDFGFLISSGRRALIAVLLALAASGAWHFARTWAWSHSFAKPRPVSFPRLARVRLAAEAFSYLTLRGIAGEPLKIVLLDRQVGAREATAAVALERIAYTTGTTLIVGIGSIVALLVAPLSAVWFKVFASFAIGAGLITLFVAAIVIGRGTYVAAALSAVDRRFGTNLRSGRVGRFAADVEYQLLDLVRNNPGRLAALMGATMAAYVFMCAEVWLVLWAMGVPVSVTDAMAIETFSRVASFASAFIPANLGALEAGSIAAVASVNAAAAGAPLALARRLRGIFWAGIGLAIYPRPRRPIGAGGSTLVYVPEDPAVRTSPFARLAGLPVAERVMRSAFRAGYREVIAVADGALAARLTRIARELPGTVTVVPRAQWDAVLSTRSADETVTVIGAGTVVSHQLLEEAAGHAALPGIPLDVPAGDEWPISSVIRMSVRDLRDFDSLARELHERIAADVSLPSARDVSWGRGRLALRMRNDAELAEAERTIRASIIKPTDNKVARWNRKISTPVSVALIRTPITANQISIVVMFTGFYAGWLYSLGTYWSMVLASVLGLAASIADGCDGEIARLKYQETALGCWLETVGDYSYYIAIFIGMAVGVARWTAMPFFYWTGIVALVATLITFALLIYLRATITRGRPDQLHAIGKARFNAEPSWWTRAVWKVSMVATRSFMPYFILGLAILGLMPLAMILAAIGANIYWISLVARIQALTDSGDTEAAAA